jgi:hypothetical protein
MSTVDNKIIPNQLNIIINTSVPGYQKIEYKPYMTIPDISKDDKKIIFNPLIKLNKSYVDKVPENLRKKQFFNKGLFDSLLNFTNGTKAGSLLQATRNGFIDNNIKITLDAIFPENTVLYINKKPYTIADFQWSKGNWKIDTKVKKSQLDSSKITDTDLYQTVVKDEIISGENQLQSLPPVIIYGANYTGPKDNTNKPIPPSSASGVVQHSPPPTPPQPPQPQPPQPPNVIEPTTKMLVSTKTTTDLRNFFKEENFFTLINMIYSASSKNVKMMIQISLSESITLNEDDDIDNLTKETYDKNVSEIKTIQNSGQGNCFFIAVADAINYHNYYNQKNRIISGRYGTGVNLYTQIYLRSLVVKYLQSWSELDSYLLNIAPVNVDELNDLFEQQINAVKLASGSPDDIAPDTYVRIANDIFNSRDNFLVKNVDRVPIEVSDYYRPFKVLEKPLIPRYILSNNFWANEIVINALCVELQLNVIPFETIKTPSGKSTLRIPYANFSPLLNNWNKYLFLYYNQSHYELITFNEKTSIQKIPSSDKLNITKIKKSKIIFDRNEDLSEIPPIYILFTIYGSYFSTIVTRQEKDTFTFEKNAMLTFESIINNNLYNTPDYNTIFYRLFKLYFPNSYIQQNPTKPIKPIKPVKPVKPPVKPVKPPVKPVKPPVNPPIKPPVNPVKSISPFEIGDPYSGGANLRYNPRYNPYYRPNYYNPPYMASRMEKKDKDKDESQLAYVISIDMELRPGTSLSPEELQNAKCNSKWNSIRKSWSELTGKPYVIPPIYNKEEKKNLKPVPQNNTRKQYNPYYKGGKHNKTVKLY